jgi:hypothetical protein
VADNSGSGYSLYQHGTYSGGNTNRSSQVLDEHQSASYSYGSQGWTSSPDHYLDFTYATAGATAPRGTRWPSDTGFGGGGPRCDAFDAWGSIADGRPQVHHQNV